MIAWKQIKTLFHAAARQEPAAPPEAIVAKRDGEPARTVIEAHRLVFRYPGRAEPVLRGVDLEIPAGARLLLEGPSGGGKSCARPSRGCSCSTASIAAPSAPPAGAAAWSPRRSSTRTTCSAGPSPTTC